MLQRLRSKGQALVEFALMATLIFFLLAATVDLGLIFFTQQGLHNAAQEGATYGSRWLATNSSGMSNLDYSGIRNRVRFEAGNRGRGFANLLDLNSNGTDDFAEDGANIGVADGTSLFPTYIRILALLDVDGSGDPTNDGTAPNYTPCPNVANKTLACFLRVEVSAEYDFQFPLAPGFANRRRLTSAYTIPMRTGISSAGTPATPAIIVTVTPPPPTVTPTLLPTPVTCTVPNFIGTRANAAQGAWSGAGFTGALTRNGSGNFTIRTQSLPANSQQSCSSSITVGP